MSDGQDLLLSPLSPLRSESATTFIAGEHQQPPPAPLHFFFSFIELQSHSTHHHWLLHTCGLLNIFTRWQITATGPVLGRAHLPPKTNPCIPELSF